MNGELANKRRRLKILRSDLHDTYRPSIVAKYPHLNSDENREQLRDMIRKLEQEIEESKR